MSRRGGLLAGGPLRAACRCVRGWLHAQVRLHSRLVGAGVVAGSLLLVPALADAAPRAARRPARRTSNRGAAAPSAVRASRLVFPPYAIAARQHAAARRAPRTRRQSRRR